MAYLVYEGIGSFCSLNQKHKNFALLEINHFLDNQNIKHPIVSLDLALYDKDELGKLYIVAYEGGPYENFR